MQLSRRGFIGGLLAVVSAPAIVRVESLMPVRAEIIRPTIEIISSNVALEIGDVISTVSADGYLTVQSISREAVKLLANSNVFIKAIDEQYDREFAANYARIGDTVRIKLPNDFTIGEGHQFA